MQLKHEACIRECKTYGFRFHWVFDLPRKKTTEFQSNRLHQRSYRLPAMINGLVPFAGFVCPKSDGKWRWSPSNSNRPHSMHWDIRWCDVRPNRIENSKHCSIFKNKIEKKMGCETKGILCLSLSAAGSSILPIQHYIFRNLFVFGRRQMRMWGDVQFERNWCVPIAEREPNVFRNLFRFFCCFCVNAQFSTENYTMAKA